MAVALCDVRSAVGDTGRTYPPAQEDPENLLPNCDGTTTTFYLSQTRYDPATLLVFLYTNPAAGTYATPTIALVSSSAYTTGPNGAIVFNAPPAATQVVAARYNVVAFSDTELTNVLNRVTTAGFTQDDRTTLAACQHDVISMLLMDVERLKTIHQERYSSDPKGVIADLRKMREVLELTLRGGVIPGQDVPAYGRAATFQRQYQTPGV